MNILLIAGHGNGDPGAVKLGYEEAAEARKFLPIIQKHLSPYANVTIADTSIGWYRHICVNGNSFNFRPYDYVLEIHFNAAANDAKGNGKTTGSEIYVTMSEKVVAVEENILKGTRLQKQGCKG